MENYRKLENHFKNIYAIECSMAMLGWDSSTFMPEASGKYRGETLSKLTGISHNMTTDKQILELLELAKTENLNDWQRANLREIKTIFDESNAIPTDLIAAYVKVYSECELIWREAKANSNFALVSGQLTELFNLANQIAEAKASYFGVPKYEALIMSFDHGRKISDIDQYFAKLEAFLPGFIDEVIEKQKSKPIPQNIKLHKSIQKQIGLEVMKDFGFDFTKGRVDESLHPFCGGVYGDTRLTTLYDEEDAIKSITAIIHETGHALYEQGLPAEYYDQPVGKALGMSIHESQSLCYEMQLGSSTKFCEYLAAKINKIASTLISPEEIWLSINQVKRSFIRIYADEVTYPLHVILRYNMEKLLINNDIKVSDIPSTWNELMKKYLNITPTKDSEGCLQDIHWYGGAIGYFPAYSLGAMTAAQIYATAKKQIDLTDLNANVFGSLKQWLHKNIHSYGSFMSADDLTIQATGEKLNPDIYINYLKEKYK